MTKEEAVEILKQYVRELSLLSMAAAVAGMEFSKSGPLVEKALGLPYETLAKAHVRSH